MTISSQTLCFEARRKCRVGFIHTQLASSYANAPQQLASSPSTVGFITRDFHALISRQYSQTNRRGLHTLFLASKSRCMQKISSVDALLTAQNVLSWSGRFGGGHTGWSQPLWFIKDGGAMIDRSTNNVNALPASVFHYLFHIGTAITLEWTQSLQFWSISDFFGSRGVTSSSNVVFMQMIICNISLTLCIMNFHISCVALLAFGRGIYRSPADSPHKGQWREDLMFSLICACTNGRVSHRNGGDLQRHHAHYDVTVMCPPVVTRNEPLNELLC